jgi:hypothetical protein
VGDELEKKGAAYVEAFDPRDLPAEHLLNVEYATAFDRRHANGRRNALVEIVEELSRHAEVVRNARDIEDLEQSGELPGKWVGDRCQGARWFSMFVEMSAPWLRPETATCFSDLARGLRDEAQPRAHGGRFIDPVQGWNPGEHQAKLVAAFEKLLSALKSVAESVKADAEADTGKDACPTFPDSPDASANDARDKWIFDQCVAGERYSRIISHLAKNHPDWQPIEGTNGIKAAANRYAERHGLRPIPKRQHGRPST